MLIRNTSFHLVVKSPFQGVEQAQSLQKIEKRVAVKRVDVNTERDLRCSDHLLLILVWLKWRLIGLSINIYVM